MDQMSKCDPAVFMQMVNALVARGNRIDSQERIDELMRQAHALALDAIRYADQNVREPAP